jgi:2-polyprenyl-3-methyl-5-hydroxy-6-metoxy-1,4-benzoquinol methylase
MPTSFNHVIPIICDQLEARQPNSVLDIGAGRGKYGLLAREYGAAKIVDAVEGEPRYITNTLRAIYSHIYVLDISKQIYKLPKDYDLIVFIDCIEHLSKEDGHKVLQYFSCPIIISTPSEDIPQHNEEYPLENHISHWTPKDFEDYPHEILHDSKGQALIVVVNP